MKKSSSKILLICPHGIGDFLMTLQGISQLINNTDLYFLFKDRANIELLKEISHKFSFEAKYFYIPKYNLRNVFYLIKLIKELRNEKFKCTISQYGVNQFLFGLLSLIIGTKQSFGWVTKYSFLNSKSINKGSLHKIYAAQRLSELVLKTLRIDFEKNVRTFIISKNKSSIKRDFIKVAFGINSAAIDSFKKWPFEKFVKLTKMILHKYKNLEIYLYGSPEEYGYSQRLVDEVKSSKVYNYCGKFNIVDSLYSIADCDLTIANCNAISHLSCLVDVNTIGIYGPTDPFITAPISRKLFPIISKEICIESCKNYSIMYMAKPNCILAISVQDVFDKFNNIILKNTKTI